MSVSMRGMGAEQVEKDEEQRTRQEGLSRLSTMMGKSTDLWRGMANMG